MHWLTQACLCICNNTPTQSVTDTVHAWYLFMAEAATQMTPQPWRQCCSKLTTIAGHGAHELAQLLTVAACSPVDRTLLCTPASRGTLALVMLLSLCTDHAGCNGRGTWQQAALAWHCRRAPAAEPADTQHSCINTRAGHMRHVRSNQQTDVSLSMGP